MQHAADPSWSEQSRPERKWLNNNYTKERLGKSGYVSCLWKKKISEYLIFKSRP